MKRALEQLGLGPCHHMYEVMPNPQQVAFWINARLTDAPDWDEVYAGYGSAVDWPTAMYWRELSKYYPQAKIVLTWRPAEQWYESFANTILPGMRDYKDGPNIGLREVFGYELEDRDHIIRVYEDHVREVQATIPADRLLTYRTGSGWEPLCEFLGVPVPDVPYPTGNTPEEFRRRGEEAKKKVEANRAEWEKAGIPGFEASPGDAGTETGPRAR